MEDAGDLSGSPRTNSEKSNLAPPSRMKLQSLPFFKDLRPSTVLGYLSSCGPSQLPSPYLSLSVSRLGSGSAAGSSESVDGVLQIYVDFLTSVQSYSNDNDNSQFTSSLSVSSLYLNKIPLGMALSFISTRLSFFSTLSYHVILCCAVLYHTMT